MQTFLPKPFLKGCDLWQERLPIANDGDKGASCFWLLLRFLDLVCSDR